MSELGRCDWPLCDHTAEAGAVVVAAGEWSRCLCHLLDDDCCPRLVPGPTAGCYSCGRTTVMQTRDRVPLHEECRRRYAMARVAIPAKGSYGRRRRG